MALISGTQTQDTATDRPAVRLRSTANIPGTFSAATGLFTVTAAGALAAGDFDGVLPAAGNRVALLSQTDASLRMIFRVSNAGAPAVQPVLALEPDCVAGTFRAGFVFWVAEGVTAPWRDTAYELTTDTDPIVPGTTTLAWQQVPSTMYTASDGVALAGANFSADSTVVRTSGAQTIADAKSFSNIPTPGSTHAARISDVEAKPTKLPVRVVWLAAPAATEAAGVLTASANGSLATAAPDGVADLAPGDRVLVKYAGGANAKNGPFTVTTVGTDDPGGAPWTMTRAVDADGAGELYAGASCYVAEGTHAGETWTCSTTGAITPGATANAWDVANLSTSAGAALGVAAAGTSKKYARGDHVHDHGNLAGGSLHAAAVAGVSDGFMTGAMATTLAAAVPNTRTLTGTAPVTVDGDNAAHDLSANRTIAIVAATTSVAGSMSAADKTKIDAVGQVAGGSFTGSVQTTDATQTTLVTYAIPADRGLGISVTVVATQSDRSTCVVWQVLAGATNAGGTSTLRGSPVVNGPTVGATAWLVTADVDDATDTIRVRVTGAAGPTNINWTCYGSVVQTGAWV